MVNIIFVGIDTSKDYVDAAVIGLRGQELMATTRYSQDQEGFEELIGNTRELERITGGELLFGIESTGIYHVPLYDFLTNRGYHVRVFNGLEIRGMRKTKIRKTHTDPIDAKMIAKALRICEKPDKRPPLPIELRDLREFCRIRKRLLAKKTRIKNQLIRDLDLVFPGVTNMFRDKLSKSFTELMERACTPKQIQRMSLEKLQKYIPLSKAKKLKAIAEKSQGALAFNKAMKFEVSSLIKEGKFVQKEIKKIERQIESEFTKQSSPIRSIIGIGQITSAVILTEFGDISKFENAKSLVAFAGIDPVIIQSGKRRFEYHISKCGSPQLRAALFQASFIGSQKNPVLKAYYDKKRSEGKRHRDAIICCARKLCHIIYSVCKNDKPFYVPSNIISEN